MDLDKVKESNRISLTTNLTTNSVTTEPKYTGNISMSANMKIVKEFKCPKGSTCLVYSDDTEILAAGQEDGSIILFKDDAEPKLLLDYELGLQDEPCSDVKVKSSPKGGYNNKVLAGYLSGHIKLWDLNIGKVIFTLKENRQLFSLNYHPRTSRFVSVGNDFKINIYDEETRVIERVLASSGIKGTKTGHTDSICSAVFHPQNQFELISAGVDNTLLYWDIRAPYSIKTLEGVYMYGDALDISEDGNLILAGISGSWDCPTKIFDYSTGKLLKNHSKSGSFIYCSKFLSTLFVGVGGCFAHTLRIINMKSEQIVAYISGLPSCVMSFAQRKKQCRFLYHPEKLPTIGISSGDKIYEVEFYHYENPFEPTDFYFLPK